MERKLDLEALVLKSGGHTGPEHGLCVMEAVAYFAGEKHSERPICASPVLTSFMIRLNDRMNDDERQRLKPYIERLIGTRDGKDQERMRILAWAAVTVFAPIALRAARQEQQAAKLESLPLHDWQAAKEACYEARKSCWSAAADAAAAAYAAAAAAYAAAYAAYAAAYADAYAAAADAYAAAAADADAYAAAAADADADAADARTAARARVWDEALKALDRALEVGKEKKEEGVA